MLKRLKSDFYFEDTRGTIIQLVHDGYKQINVITSKKGVFRGGHYHKNNDEVFYIISGKLEVLVNDEKCLFSSGDFFGIDAGDMHSFKFLEDSIIVSMYSTGVEMENDLKDIYTSD